MMALVLMLAMLGGCRETTRRDTLPPEHRLATTQAATAPSVDQAISTSVVARFDARAAVEYLASEELEGRGVDTDGLDLAADYIAGVFRSMELVPLPGHDDYFQPFEIVVSSTVDQKTALRSGNRTYELNRDYAVASFSGEKAFEGAVVFAGYGISSEEMNYDDYAGLNAKGKVVIAMRFEPHDERGKSRFGGDTWSNEATLGRKARAAADHGAVALLLVNPPQFHEGDVLMPFAQRFAGGRSSIPVLHISQATANELLQRGQVRDLAALQKAIDDEGRPASAELAGVIVSGQVAIQRNARTIRNVMAMLPGEGPRADEYIVVGAHYDHLGYGGSGSLVPTLRAIHPGADDNASGTAGMLRIADLLTSGDGALDRDAGRGAPYERSIVFIAFTGEERGLLGSSHFVNHPPVPLEKIAAMLNLDMVGRVRSDVLYIGGTGTAKEFDALVKRANALSPLSLRSAGRSGFAASDHMAFALKKVPVLFFWSGIHRDYHRPSDTAEKINYEGIEQIAQLGAWMVRQLTEAPRPMYVEVPAAMARATTGPGVGPEGRRASLGVVPDYTADEAIIGAKIGGTVPGTAAAGAGLREGDIITGWGNQPVTSLYDLTDLLSRAKPGDTVRLKIQRGQEEITRELTLGERTQ